MTTIVATTIAGPRLRAGVATPEGSAVSLDNCRDDGVTVILDLDRLSLNFTFVRSHFNVLLTNASSKSDAISAGGIWKMEVGWWLAGLARQARNVRENRPPGFRQTVCRFIRQTVY